MISNMKEPYTELNPAVLKEQRKQEYERLQEEFGGTKAPKISKSTTSSQILGLNPVQKKRVRKAGDKDQEKLEARSQRSGCSNNSKASRSTTNGRYEGGTKFGDCLFIKKGLSKGGN
jgi:hypothetical protein